MPLLCHCCSSAAGLPQAAARPSVPTVRAPCCQGRFVPALRHSCRTARASAGSRAAVLALDNRVMGLSRLLQPITWERQRPQCTFPVALEQLGCRDILVLWVDVLRGSRLLIAEAARGQPLGIGCHRSESNNDVMFRLSKKVGRIKPGVRRRRC